MAAAQWWHGFAAWAAGPLAPSPLAMGRARDAVGDTVACLVAGLDTPVARAAAQALDPGPEARAFHWAAAAHALDYDDFDVPSVAHPSAVLVPAVLALGAELGASGRDCLIAYIVGLEAMDRMGEVVNPAHYEAGWHATATLGALGAAAAAARLRGLATGPMLSALSIGAGMAGGMKAQFGTQAKPLNAGFAARTGLSAAALAAAGVTASAEALGPRGFSGLFVREGGTPMPSGPPGQPLAIEQYGLVVKRYPCCGYLGRILDLCGALRREPGFDPAAIAAVEVEAPPRNAAVIAKGIPRDPDEARFSAVYCVAAALLHGDLRIADFSEAAIRRPEVLALAARVRLTPSPGPQGPADLAPGDPDRVTLVLADGRRISRLQGHLCGSPEHPLTPAEHQAKLADCADGRIDATGLAALGAVLAGLDGPAPVRALTGLLPGGGVSSWASSPSGSS